MQLIIIILVKNFLLFTLAIIFPPIPHFSPVYGYIPFLGGGKEPGLGMTPIDSWAPLCVQKAPRRLGGCHSCGTHRQQSL